MKLKNKLVIGAACLIAISGVAAGTSTYAWYTATRSNTVTLSNTAYSTATGISISLYSDTTHAYTDDGITHSTGNGNTDADGTEDGRYTIAATKHITDTSYSGIGGVAHKPSINSADNLSANGWFTKATASSYVHKFTYVFTSSGQSKVRLYLSPKSTLTASITTENAALRFSMVSVPVQYDTATSKFIPNTGNETLLAYAAPNTSKKVNDAAVYGNYAYLTGDDTLSDTSSKTLASLNTTAVDSGATTTSTKIIDNNNFFSKTSNYQSSELKTDDYKLNSAGDNVGYIAELDPTAGATAPASACIVSFYVWVEGTDTAGKTTDYTLSSNFDFYTLAA